MYYSYKGIVEQGILAGSLQALLLALVLELVLTLLFYNSIYLFFVWR